MEANLVLLANGASRRVFSLSSDVTVIGRRRNCDLRIPLESVSRRHCQLTREGDQLQLQDLGSRNGTFLNGKQVETSGVKAGDVIKVGPLVFTVQVDGLPENVMGPDTRPPSTRKPTDDKQDALADSALDLDDELDLDLDDSDVFGDLDLDDD